MAKSRASTSTYYQPPKSTMKFWNNTGATYGQEAGSLANSIMRKSGTDETLNSSSNKGGFNWCDHSKKSYTCHIDPSSFGPAYWSGNYNPFGTNFTSGGSWGGLAEKHAQSYSYFISGAGTLTASAAVSKTVLEQSCTQALQAMMPSFSDGNSALNFVLELKDFRRIVRSFTSTIENTYEKILALIGASWYKSRVTNISTTALQYEFAWKPLVRDISRLYQSISMFEKRWKSMIDNQRTIQTRRYRYLIPNTAVARSSVGVGADNNPLCTFGVFVPTMSARLLYEPSDGIKFHATMRFRYSIPPEFVSAYGKLKAFLDVLGVNSNPAILWNAIPFSFVIDWLVNVGQTLEQFKLDNFQIQTEVLDFCYSVKAERTMHLELDQRWFNGSSYYWTGWKRTDTVQVSTYIRALGIPNFQSAMLSSGLSPREIALGGALLGAKYGGRRKR